MTADLIFAFTVPPVSSWGWRWALRGSMGAFFAGWLAGAATGAVLAATQGAWGYLAGSAATGAAGAVAWWLYRRKRKRAPRALGAKSRARIAALVARARQAARPRRVLRPVPGGAP